MSYLLATLQIFVLADLTLRPRNYAPDTLLQILRISDITTLVFAHYRPIRYPILHNSPLLACPFLFMRASALIASEGTSRNVLPLFSFNIVKASHCR